MEQVPRCIKVRTCLFLLAAAALLPSVVFSFVLLAQRHKEELATLERGMRDTARALSAALDREFLQSIQALRVLGTSDHLSGRRLREFHDQMRRARTAYGSVWQNLTLTDETGQQLLNLRRPYGSPLPTTGNPEALERARREKAPVIADLSLGPVTRAPAIVVHVPILRDGDLRYFLNAIIYPAMLSGLLREQQLPAGWVAAIIDGRNQIVARSRDIETFLGTLVPIELPAKVGGSDGWRKDVTEDDVPAYIAFARSSLTGWTFLISAPTAGINASVNRTLAMNITGSSFLLGFGLLAGSALARRIATSIYAVASQAETLLTIGDVKPAPLPSTPITEVVQVSRAMEAAALKRQQAEKKRAESEEQKARLYEEVQRNLNRIRALHEIDLAIISSLDIEAVLEVLQKTIPRFVPPITASTVRLINKATEELEPASCWNLDRAEWEEDARAGGASLADLVLQTGKPVKILNLSADSIASYAAEFSLRHGLVSYLGVPLSIKGETLGVIGFFSSEEHNFSDEEVEFLSTLAGQAVIAIHNSQLYQETKTQALKLERSNKIKDQFLAVMSHELRTPLTAAMGYMELIQEGFMGEINPKQQEGLQKVLKLSNELLAMVNNVLQATSLYGKALGAYNREVHVGELLEELRGAYAAPLGKRLSLVWDYQADVPRVTTDGEKLSQILRSLIDNAIKFTEEGQVTVAARWLSEKGALEFAVHDTGIGIPEQMRSRIFELFSQADSSDTRKYGGMGLGLYIARELAALLGGEIRVKSELGNGSTFTVTLPCKIY